MSALKRTGAATDFYRDIREEKVRRKRFATIA